MNIIEDVRNLFIEQKFINKGEVLDDSASLLEIIDSLGIQELLTFIEARYNIRVDEDDLMPENFDSLIAINDYISRKMS